MKNKNKTKFVFVGLIFIVLLISVFYAKKTALVTQKECSDRAWKVLIEQSERVDDIPSFIGGYWPTKTEKLTLPCYFLTADTLSLRRGVGVSLVTLDIAKYEVSENNDSNSKPFTDRVSLYVDGDRVADSSKVVVDNITEVFFMKDGNEYFPGISSGYEISWTPLLLPGVHIAKVEIQTKSGELFEFDWRFTVVMV
jgi:hypothetical protein